MAQTWNLELGIWNLHLNPILYDCFIVVLVSVPENVFFWEISVMGCIFFMVFNNISQGIDKEFNLHIGSGGM